ncbi:MAG: SpoIIE family protein phosphatase [Vicingus serpentipes]|nr:SpoIIE family protein phosphatase [Vicingus serpentipes]
MSENQTIRNNWETELDKIALKYHIITLWVAVVFNLLFFITDYINMHQYWREFLTFRVVVSSICLITVLFYKQLKISIQLMGVIPVLLISIENAFIWGCMDAEHLQRHTLAYMALFIGSGMFVFYHVYYSVFIVIASVIANIVFFYFNSPLTPEEILVNGGFLTAAVAVFSILLIKMRLRLTKKELIARFALEASKHQLQIKNKEIVDSINYAKRIQSALIPPVEVVKDILPNSFLLFKPKDIVSGDFYWVTAIDTAKGDKRVAFSVADCTGHGVPGAFMSIIGLKIFNQTIKQEDINSPAKVLNYLNKEVYQAVNKHSKSDNVIRDGMDVAFCVIDFDSLLLSFSGAQNPVYIVRNKELTEIKGDKQPIGSDEGGISFTDKELQLEKGDMIYIFSDGYADQFGGAKGKKFKYSQFKETLITYSDKSIEEQEHQLEKLFEDWKGDLEQLDDVCVLGVRV